ncbi:sigma-70 family RNA polymerase sigma factor [uncultured Maribacter sp.]|uniref:RNA polymerase sigma factor n=1 Tax=uncultured Maribacter sp. TaxID=431308 RepID=UPI00262DE87E|nr:sigma-70 family RNA polymerase sigma factor [uncultured Maribacter sp.]
MKTKNNKADAILWKDLKKGDVLALGIIYDTYIDDLFEFGMHYSQDKSYVMDCVHDLFLDLYKYRAKLIDTDNIKNYLFKSLKRKINRKYHSKTVNIPNAAVLNNRNSIPSIEENLILQEHNTEKIQKLKKALVLLTRRQKEGISLRFNENKPYEEIAETLNVSIQTSRTIIYRGIKILRQHLATISLFTGTLFFF